MESKEMKQLFINIMKRCKKRHKFELTNICIMSNHVHFIIKPSESECLSDIMKWLFGTYAINYNLIMKIKGHLWYDRYKSFIIPDINEFIRIFHYITNNPVNAQMVNSPTKHPFNGISDLIKKKYDLLDPPPPEILELLPIYK